MLQRMQEISENCKAETLVLLQNNYYKAVIIQGLAFYTHFARVYPVDALNPEKLFEFLEAMQRPMTDLAQSLVKLSAHAVPECKAAVERFFLTPFANKVLGKLISLVNAQSDKIPANYENWILNRNVPKIKQVCFDQPKHEAIVNHMELYRKGISITDQLFAALAESQTLGAPQISKLKSAQSSLRTLSQYSINVHGLNVVINRMPGEGRRERASMVREYFGNAFRNFFLTMVQASHLTLPDPTSSHFQNHHIINS